PAGVPGRKAAAANAIRKKKGLKGGKGNAGAGAGAGSGIANATTTTSAAAGTTTAADNVAAADTGIKDVVEMCLNGYRERDCSYYDCHGYDHYCGERDWQGNANNATDTGIKDAIEGCLNTDVFTKFS
ncbi:hypothetical protein EXIGLDRAFT_762225, partial [Exidia glandulosa HHB12029]